MKKDGHDNIKWTYKKGQVAFLIIIGGMIGLGKSSVAKLLGEHFDAEVFYESVEDNPVLPLFYTSSNEEIERNRYPFLSQLYFLDSKIKNMKKAIQHRCAVMDRSIYEDWYFAKVNKDLGRISELEYQLYERLLCNMKEELENQQNKDADLMIYLKGSFDTVLSRIMCRGRSYELDDHLKAYYMKLWENYDEWILKYYQKDEILWLDMDETDIINRPQDAERLIKQVEEKLKLVSV